MKITLGSKTLLEKLQALVGVLSSKSTLPILENFHFQVVLNQLTITSSDLETTMSTTFEVQAEGDCDIAIPAKMIIETLKSFPDQPIVFEIKDTGTIQMTSSSGDYSIAYHDGNEFPKAYQIEKPSTIEIPANVLATAISKTIFATGTDDLRPVMTGVLFQLSMDQSNFVATDAHKLVKYSREDITVEESAEFVIPRKPLNIIKSVIGSSDVAVKTEFNQSNVTFYLDGYTLTCRLIDAKYPNYEAVIPKDNPNVMTINRIQFLNAVKCVSIFANKLTHQLKLDISGNELIMSAEDADYSNKAEERLTCNYTGEDLIIGFNSKFLIEMLSSLHSENIQLEMSLPNRAGIITPIEGLAPGENLLMLVMPVLINSK